VLLFLTATAGREALFVKKTALVFALIMTTAYFLPVVSRAAPISEYPHYLEANSSRYAAYRTGNPGTPVDMVIAYVNANVDLGGYNGIIKIKNPESVSALVNKNFVLPSSYVPDDLVTVEGKFRLREEAAAQFIRMKTDMNALGYKVYLMAGYRTYQRQSSKHSGAVNSSGLALADIQFARPGHSEHQTGLAIDIVQKTGIKYMTQAAFESSREFAWLMKNAHRYGFILRYPENYTDIHGFIFEPWHWRYVGSGIATTMYNDGIIMFEEYYGWFLAPGVRSAKIEKARLPLISQVVLE